MFTDFKPFVQPLLAARLLREEVLAAPLPPPLAATVREQFLSASAPEADARAALDAALVRPEPANGVSVSRADLDAIAAAAGSSRLRPGPGAPFHGQAAPASARVASLLDELLETVNSPVAVEAWPPVVRAFALHFLLLLVQPYEVAPGAVGRAAEALLLAREGFRAGVILLPDPQAGVPDTAGKPDPDAFALARVHALVASLGDSRDQLHRRVSLCVALWWSRERAAGLNRRQRELVAFLAGEGGRTISFRDYSRLLSGRRAPSLRSLQRDFQQLREERWIRPVGDAFELHPHLFAFGDAPAGPA